MVGHFGKCQGGKCPSWYETVEKEYSNFLYPYNFRYKRQFQFEIYFSLVTLKRQNGEGGGLLTSISWHTIWNASSLPDALVVPKRISEVKK